MLSVGSLSFASSRWSGRSGVATPKSRASTASTSGAAAERGPLGGRQRPHVAVEVLDEHTAGVVLHGRQQLGQAHRGIGRPVAVVARVQVALGAVDGHGHAGAAAHAEVHRGPAARMPRAVERDRQVGLERGGSRGRRSGGSWPSRPPLRRRARRARSSVARARWPRSASTAFSERHDRPFVVGGRAPVEPPLGIEGGARGIGRHRAGSRSTGRA